MRAVIVLGVCLVVAAPATAIIGTETNPELKDPPGDVEYDPLYPGSQDHDYLDVVAGWFSYDPYLDSVNFTLKMADSTGLSEADSNLHVFCDMEAEIAVRGDVQGHVRYSWNKPAGEDTLSSKVNWVPDTDNPEQETPPIAHTFEHVAEAPGYFVWTVERPSLHQWGDEATALTGRCGEVFAPGEVTPVAENGDDASGRETYSMNALEPIDPDDPDANGTSPTRESTPPSDGSESPSLGVIATLSTTAIVAGAIGFTRTKNQR